ncbi:hypothetical protein EAX61_01355 [Dokdonia sinensis]|uniref:Uncharacterized protein n=1 Tax=Dokdonia sinensis TaxID=2479847 RepID=A0A3M0GGK4_9FLAO|nr:hypothetical protein [Dokdonia sinensis]RMB64055.1 hypothetical protein EAX61_01355 [Dokdonia sinensis]
MRNNTKHILQKWKAAILILTFLIPLGVSFAHSLEGHEHFDTCKVASDTHVHENDLDCSIGDIQLVKIGMYAFAKAEKTILTIPSENAFFYSYAIVSLDTKILADRGPPLVKT